MDFTQHADRVMQAVLRRFSKEGQSSSYSICLTLAVFWCRFRETLAALRCTASSLSVSFSAAGSHTVHECSRMCTAGEADKQNSSREMYSPLRRNTNNNQTQALSIESSSGVRRWVENNKRRRK